MICCYNREDLEAMDEAVAEAKTAGVSEAVGYMVESSILKDRGEKQLEAQMMLTQALASLSKSKMRGVFVCSLFFISIYIYLLFFCCFFFILFLVFMQMMAVHWVG